MDSLTSHFRENGDSVKFVGVFQNVDSDKVNKIASDLGLDYVQLHGIETPDYCAKIKVKIIKVLSLSKVSNLEKIKADLDIYKVAYYLIDREKQGEGDLPDSLQVKELVQSLPIMLAGGLTPENVSAIVMRVRTLAVDVAGGIETNGEQDGEKIRLFIKNAKG